MSNTSQISYRTRFLMIVDELRSALGYSLRELDADPGEELAMEMMYGNFDFAVVHSQRFRPDRVLIECTFGEIPTARKEIILEQLLQMNGVLAELDGSAFSIDITDGKLLYMLPLKISSLDGLQLLSKMTEITWHGRKWLDTRYLKIKNLDMEELPNPIFLA